MIFRGILLTLLIGSTSHVPANPYAEFSSSQAILLVGEVLALSRSERPLAVIEGDLIRISNSCGYDTAIIKVNRLIDGEYEPKEISAYLRLNEWCNGLFQNHVDEYLLSLRWNGMVWEVDLALSSRLVPDGVGDFWIVEPDLIAEMEVFGLGSEEVTFNTVLLENIALDALVNTGIGVDPDATRYEQIEELRGYKPVYGDWPGNPLYFGAGIRLDEFIRWLSANKSLNTDAEHVNLFRTLSSKLV